MQSTHPLRTAIQLKPRAEPASAAAQANY